MLLAAVDEDAIGDNGLPAIGALRPLARLGADEWSTIGEMREITRIANADWPGTTTVRAPTDTIIAPLFPSGATWLNGPAQSPISRGRPMLLEFFDYALPNSMRTLPYMVAWHERYGEDGPAG